jgi:hypothetical protein
MEKKEIMDKVIEILSKHGEHTSEGGIYWEYEWVGGKQIPDGIGGYKQIGGERVSAEEAFYKEMTDFISQELDKAREEERFKVLRELSLEIDGVDLDNYITENTDYFNRLGESMMKKVKELVKLKDNK